MATLEEHLAKVTELPSPSDALLKALAILRGEDFEIRELEELVRSDPSMSMTVLRLANSAKYAGAQEVGGIRDAMSRLGFSGLRRAILAHQGGALMAQAGRGYGLDANNARMGALAGALTSERLAEELGENTDVAFSAGLLRDCGKILLDHVIGVQAMLDDFKELESRPGSEIAQLDYERETYGFDHAEAGAALAKSWGLPDAVVHAISEHHDPQGENLLVDIVHVGDIVCAHLGLGVGMDGLAYKMNSGSLERVGLELDQLSHHIIRTISELADFDV